jgi:hypothetical protein
MRAFFAEGVDKMHIPWAVEGLPALLHLSVFLFFGGLAIFLFNIDHAVFGSVILWLGLFSIVYGLITVMPIVRHSSPYYSPLSRTAWFLYGSMNYVIFKVFASITYRYASDETWEHFFDLMNLYRGWMLGGVEKAAEEMVEERSSEIDIRIVDWTMGVLGEDDSLEKFFEAIPGLFSSKLVKDLERDIPWELFDTFWFALKGFMDRTSSSNSVTESVKSHRVVICRDIMSMIPFPFSGYDNPSSHFYQAPISIEKLQVMARWITNKDGDLASCARAAVSRNLFRMQEHDDDWIALASNVYGSSERDLRVNVALGGNSTLLAILIDVSRRAIHSQDWNLVETLTRFDIHHTLPRLQHDFCTLWNELVQEARSQAYYHATPFWILRDTRHHYIALHQGTDAAPTAFSASTNSAYFAWRQASSYPLCQIASHRPGSTTVSNSPAVSLFSQPGGLSNASPDPPSRGGSAVPQQAELLVADINAGPPSPSDPTTPSEIGHTSQPPAATSPALPVHTTSHPTDTSPPGTATALQDTPPAATLSHPLEGTTQRDIVASSAEPDIDESLSIASASCEPDATPTFHPFLPASSISIPASRAQSCPPPLPNPDLLASAPSAAEVAATSFACPDGPTAEIDSGVLGEASQAPIQHPVPVPATITPPTGPDPSDDPVALQSTTSSAYLYHPQEGNAARCRHSIHSTRR